MCTAVERGRMLADMYGADDTVESMEAVFAATWSAWTGPASRSVGIPANVDVSTPRDLAT
ncbi:hypothetical protein GCM10009670_27760 [Citricoccus alkalitolerans]